MSDDPAPDNCPERSAGPRANSSTDPQNASQTAMGHLNVEIKARCDDPAAAMALLTGLGADLQGLDEQTDTYYRVPHGRLKLRRGQIENSLIHYQRPDSAAPKQSLVRLADAGPAGVDIEHVLQGALDIDVVVSKRRTFYGPVGGAVSG